MLPYWYGPKAARRDYFWAQVLLQDPQAAATELEHAVTELGAQGVSIGGANFGGRQAHDPRGPGSSLPLDRRSTGNQNGSGQLGHPPSVPSGSAK